MAPSPVRRLPSFLFIGLLLTISGCLPLSCQPGQSRALFPADSLSREFAETTSIDTLTTVWETRGGSDLSLIYPRTVRFDSLGNIFASDAQNNAIYKIDREDGAFIQTFSSLSFETPYIAGIRSDTILVFNPSARRIDYIADDNIQLYAQLPEDESGEERLQYVTVGDDGIYYKVVHEDFEGYVAQLSNNGTIITKTPVPEPYWRYAGAVRVWDDQVVSLSAYRPVIDLVTSANTLDSLALFGFDSPMLARSRSYMLGGTRQPPLLYSSAVPMGDLLFVLNLRPGWLRIDAFDQKGTLKHRLVQHEPGFNKEFYPIDIDVRQSVGGVVELVVAYIKPEPKISLYTWVMDS